MHPGRPTGDDERGGLALPAASSAKGATLVPRFLCLVEPAAAGPLGGAAQAPLVDQPPQPPGKAPLERPGPTDRATWNANSCAPSTWASPLRPFRLLDPPLGVIPWDSQFGLLDAASAGLAGYSHLAAWMSNAERLWNEHRRSDRLSFAGQLDYYGKLRAQFPVPPLRVVYCTSGTHMAAAVVTDSDAVIDTKLYWASVQDISEAHYLVAVLTSEATRRRFAPLQSRGQWGARDFHKVMWTLPIKEFDSDYPLHTAIAEAGRHAETIAAQVPLREGIYFTTARRRIRTDFG